MRLAIVNHLGKVGAGAEHSLLQLLGHLPEGVEPIFFFFEDGDLAQAMRERFGSVTILQMSERIAGAKRSRLPVSAVADSVALTWRLADALRRALPDMVLTNSMKAHIIGSLAAKLVGLPCVNYVHDFVTGRALSLLQLVSRICAVERLTSSKAVAANMAIPRTSPLYEPIETAVFHDLPERSTARTALGLPNDGLPVVALVGRIARWKGQDRFIRIAVDVLRDTDAHFVIVGSPLFGCDPQYVPELQAAVAGAGMQHRIHFAPWQNDMRTVYAAVDLACNCSTREPFGRTSLEALASSIPIVCFDDAGICEILTGQDAGSHVPAGDEVAFARAVHAYLNDSGRMVKARKAARATAEPIDIANVSRTFADVLQRVGSTRALQLKSSDSMELGQTTASVPR